MPDIFDVARHFDDTPIVEAYTSAPLYNGQFSTFLEASPDGSTSQRRTLSLAPDYVIPARRCITALGETYVVGYGTVDGFYGQVIRRSYWMKRVSGLFTVRSPGLAALNTGGVQAYGHKDYLKDLVNNITDSEYDPFWDIYFSEDEVVAKSYFLELSGTLYRVRSAHVGLEGLLDAACDEVDAGARVSCTFTSLGAYNPSTDAYAPGTLTTPGILLDRYSYYELRTEADAKTMPGDMTLVVASSAITPVVGKTVTISGRSWRIEAVTADLDSYALHIRRA